MEAGERRAARWPRLAAGGEARVAALVAVFDPYRKTLEAHLKEEDRVCVPLMFAYFEPKYVGKKVGEIMQTMDKTLGQLVDEARQGSQKEFRAVIA